MLAQQQLKANYSKATQSRIASELLEAAAGLMKTANYANYSKATQSRIASELLEAAAGLMKTACIFGNGELRELLESYAVNSIAQV